MEVSLKPFCCILHVYNMQLYNILSVIIGAAFVIWFDIFCICVVQIQKRHSSSSMDERPSPSLSAREYVESLHQNNRVTLLFGKNNVLVQPVTLWLLLITDRYVTQ